MKSMLRIQILAAVITSAAFATPAMAQRGGGDGQKKPGADSLANPFRGTVESASAASIKVQGEAPTGGGRAGAAAKPAARDVSFAITSDTKILRDGKPIAAADLRRDETVQVAFTSKPGSTVRHATEIQSGNSAGGNGRKPAK